MDNKIQVSAPNGCLFFLSRHIASEGDVTLDGSDATRTSPLVTIMKRRVADPIVQATTIVVVLKLIRVRAHTRVRLGKIEKVRSHWRRLRGACTETCVTVSK